MFWRASKAREPKGAKQELLRLPLLMFADKGRTLAWCLGSEVATEYK